MTGFYEFTCPSCGHRMRVKQEQLGRMGKCTRCQYPVQVSVSAAAPITKGRREQTRRRPPTEERQRHPLDWREGDVILGLYEVGRVFEGGGMARVYRVRHRAWHMDLAVKVPRARILKDPRGAKNFERECETWANLGLHPHVVSCHFVRQFGGLPIVFVEYVEGGSLQDWIRSGRLYAGGGSAALRRILDVAIQMAWGLEHAHNHGLVHQDVKPANTLMASGGVAKVTDFGLARAQSGLQEAPGAAPQNILVSSSGMTPAYCSPEQARRERLTLKTDLWSWGVSVLEMFTGEVTWVSGRVAREALDAYGEDGECIAAQRFGVPKMPGPVAELLRACFDPSPEARPANMACVAAKVIAMYRQITGVPFTRPAPVTLEQQSGALRAANLNNRAISMLELGRHLEASGLFRQATLEAKGAREDVPGEVLQDLAYNRVLSQLGWEVWANPKAIVRGVPEASDPKRQAFLVGLLLLRAGELHEAIATLTQALSGEEAYRTDAFNARGIGLLLVGETRPAIVSFQQAFGLAPDRLDILRNLALAYSYDRQSRRALRIYEHLARATVFDSEDWIRYATVLAAAGQQHRALEAIDRALKHSGVSTAVRLTAAELLAGVQSFLPGVIPVQRHGERGKALIAEALEAEPRNLRALVDLQTWPRRKGLKGGAVIRNRRRELLTDGSPARIGGCIASSYKALTKRFRWGDIQAKNQRRRLVFLSSLPVFAWAMLVGITMEQEAGEAAVLCAAAIYFGALFFTARGAPSSNVWRDLLFMLPVCAVPLAAGLYLRAQNNLQGFARILVAASLAIPPAFLLWQLGFQRLTCRARALPRGDRAAQHTSTRQARSTVEKGLRELQQRDSEALQRSSGSMRRTALLLRAVHSVGPGLTRFWDRLSVAFWGWLVYLIPQVAATMYLYQALEDPNLRFFLPMFILPLVLVPFSPWLMLLLNCLVSPALGFWVGVTVVNPYLSEHLDPSWLHFLSVENRTVSVNLIASAFFVFLNWRAMRGCPEFVPEWTSCSPKQWDIRQMVDPLNIRRYAAPWQLVPPDIVAHDRKEPHKRG